MYQLTFKDGYIRHVETDTVIPPGHRLQADYEAWLAAGNTPLPMPAVDPAIDVRAKRDALLRGCDWTQLADNNLTTLERTAWTAYRQQLRDLPLLPGFPDTINWPTPPALEPDDGDASPELG